MFTNNPIIGIFFRLFNFAILIGLFVYLFKKYGKAVFVELLEKKDADRALLLSEQATLEKKQSELDLLIAQEIRDCEKLREKIDIWKTVVDNEKALYEKEYEKIGILAEKKGMLRAEQTQQEYIRSMVLERLIPQLHNTLTDHFQEEENGRAYTEAIVRFMDKG
jgi:hypothetical protein